MRPVSGKLFFNGWQAPVGLGLMMDQGPLFACLAMLVSVLFCFLFSLLARKLGWPSGAENTEFYGEKV